MVDLERIREEAAGIAPFLVATRRDIHAHPELGHAEARTALLVSEELSELGMDVRTEVGGTGVVGTLVGTRENPTIALRADMDALPIDETGDREFRSTHAGVMHACGHDAHTAMLLGAARVLARMRDTLPGRVKFLFQPAEETYGGASDMIADGCLDGVDAVFGLHVWPFMEPGVVGIRGGAIMASSDALTITVQGRGGHASEPHTAVDPVPIAAQVITNLQLMVTRRFDAREPVVLSICYLQAGTAFNVIPDTVQLAGTVRCVHPDARDRLERLVEDTVKHTCSTFGADYEMAYVRGSGVVMNEPRFTEFLGSVCRDVFGPSGIHRLEAPIMGAEDFGAYTERVPGAFAFIGAKPAHQNAFPCHHPQFDLNEEVLPLGVTLHVGTAMEYLRAHHRLHGSVGESAFSE